MKRHGKKHEHHHDKEDHYKGEEENEALKKQIDDMQDELEHLRNLPPKIETRIEKVIEKVEVIPHDYDDL